jgi:hypothetical protein
MPQACSSPESSVSVTMTKPSSVPNIVTIVYDTTARKLRARATDGIHGEANVAFPNALRIRSGLQYEVEELIWNGKNYRVSGEITPVNNSVSNNTPNINEDIKENYEMNFINAFAELDKLYESVEPEQLTEAVDEEEVAEDPVDEVPAEEVEDEEIEIEDDEAEVEEEPEAKADEEVKQVILECSNCGGLLIKAITDITVDEASDLVNIEDACQYCEEANGYKIIGELAPYTEEADEDVEAIEEGIFNRKKNDNASGANKESKVTIEIYDENGTKQFSHVFTELPGKMNAVDQFNQAIKSNGVLNRYKASPKKSDWSYERKSDPASSFDTDKYFNAASKIIRESLESEEENLE